jgi:hypothetical protein
MDNGGKAQRDGGAPQDEPSAGWTVLKEWSGGPGSLDTDRFTTAVPAFRVVWTLKDLGRGGILDVFVRGETGKLIKSAISLQSKDTTQEYGTGAGQIDVAGAPGIYYLEILSAGVEWTVAVEQRKGGKAP